MSEPITISRGYRFRLYPTPEQEAVLEQFCGTVRSVYNAAWEQRERFWRQYHRVTGRHISFVSQSAEIKFLRAQFDWIDAVPWDSLTYALRDLDRAYQTFFAGRSAYPTPRRRGVNDSFRVKGVNARTATLNRRWSAVHVPKLGMVKYRAHRPMSGVARGVTISRRSGEWWVAFSCDFEAITPSRLPHQVGIDRGIAQTLTLSTGEVMQTPSTERITVLRKRAQRVLARRKKGSNRYAAQRSRAASLGTKATAVRADWCHRTSTDIARRFGLVALEDLRIRSMTASAKGTVMDPGRGVRQKAGLNRSILEQCWGQFETMLSYKLAERDGALIKVPAAYTSQTCSACGVIDARSRKSQAVFECVACGHSMNADHNAACEILRRSTALTGVEGLNIGPSKRQPQECYHA